jgi:anti-sigma factor RsiW
MNMDCQQIEASLSAVADRGATAEEAALVARHLESCASCRDLLQAQATARAVLRSRAAQLSVTAPPGLRTRIAATARAEHAESAAALGWRSRLSAFGAAAILVLTIGAILLPVVTERSSVVMAAQLALDHLKCFVIDGDASGAPISKAEAEATIERDHGWRANVPASVDGLELMAVRHCLYGDGLAAHVLYRAAGQPVSLFILPGVAHPAAELRVLGHDEVVWTHGDRTFVLVSAAGTKAELARVASHVQNEAK